MTTTTELETREDRNALFSVLGNHRRRYVLYACNQAEGALTLSDVAEQVAAWEYDKTVDQLTSTERKRVYTSIQQHHLPKLEDAGLIEVDGDRISTTRRAEDLDVYLEIVPQENIPWAVYYLGLAALGAASLTIAVLGWLPDILSVSVVAGLVVIAFAVSALAHLFDSQRMKFDSADSPPEIEK